MKKPHTNSEGTKPEPAASGPCAFPYAEIPQTDEQLPEVDNPFSAHLADLKEIHERLYALAVGLGAGDAAEEAEGIARAVACVAADLGGDIEKGGAL